MPWAPCSTRYFQLLFFFFSSRRRHTRSKRDWSSDVCSSDLGGGRTNFSRIVTNSSAALGWMPTVWSNIFFEAPHLTAIARPWTISGASAPSIWRSEERRVGKEWRSGWGRERRKEEVIGEKVG